MNPLANDWPIKHRAEDCALTHRQFEAGEQFYTLLFREGAGYRREDLSEEAWKARNENIRPFSCWKTRYEPPPAAPPEPLAKDNAEDLLRRLPPEQSTPDHLPVPASLPPRADARPPRRHTRSGRRSLTR